MLTSMRIKATNTPNFFGSAHPPWSRDSTSQERGRSRKLLEDAPQGSMKSRSYSPMPLALKEGHNTDAHSERQARATSPSNLRNEARDDKNRFGKLQMIMSHFLNIMALLTLFKYLVTELINQAAEKISAEPKKVSAECLEKSQSIYLRALDILNSMTPNQDSTMQRPVVYHALIQINTRMTHDEKKTVDEREQSLSRAEEFARAAVDWSGRSQSSKTIAMARIDKLFVEAMRIEFDFEAEIKNPEIGRIIARVIWDIKKSLEEIELLDPPNFNKAAKTGAYWQKHLGRILGREGAKTSETHLADAW